MSSKQKTAKPLQDPYAQRGKTLASSVQRLRGWVGTDPARAPELADALVELTAHRLLGHGYAAAANDAQESVRRAAELLTAPGPIGPYTSVADAGRYVTAVVHLAALQAGIGQAEAAGRTLESLQPLHDQLDELGLELALGPTTAVWALACSARASLAGGDVATANSYADAAAAQLTGPRHDDDPDLASPAIDVDRLVADCRWAAGRPADSLALLHRARLRYEALVDGRLATPGRLSPALLERLAEPFFGLYRDLADRLVGTGETDTGLDVRRVLIETLRVVAPRIGDRAQVQLALTLSDLASDLALVDRLAEADDVAAEAAALAKDWPPGTPSRWFVTAVQAQVAVRNGRAAEAVDVLRRLADAGPDLPRSAAQAVGLRTLTEALRQAGDPEAATAEQAYRELAAQLVPTGAAETLLTDRARGVVSRGEGVVSWTPLPAANPYLAAVPGPADPDAAPVKAWRQDSDAWLEAERAEAHRREADRHEQARREAERSAAEQREAERVAAEQRDAERARAEEDEAREAERRAAAEEEERVERKRRREERLDEHRREQLRREIDQLGADADAGDPTAVQQREQRLAELAELDHDRPTVTSAGAEPEPSGPAPVGSPPEPEPEPRPRAESPPEPVPTPEVAEAVLTEPAGPVPAKRADAPDELGLAEQAWTDARARGDRRAARSANDRVVELLRSRAEADPAAYAGRLQEALEALASARLRGGDVFGSRSAAREARALARRSDR